MKIIDTNIPDITNENLNEAKINLADRIIENVFPLFDELYSKKLSNLKDKKNHSIEVIKRIQKEKEELKQIHFEFEKKKKIKKLLERISQLVSLGLTNEGTMKRETIMLLKIIEHFTCDQLDFHFSQTMRILNKRFAK